MNKLVPVGRTFFALALIGLGVDHFIFGAFVMGRAPAWPTSLPGGLAWAYLTGMVFVGSGLALLTGKQARSAAILVGILVFLWALLRHLPVVATSPLFSGAWTNAGKALRFIGGILAVAATFPKVAPGRSTPLLRFMNHEGGFILVGQICLGLTLILNGTQHFIFVEFVASLIPAWFPGDAVFWTYFGGVALIAGGLGLLIPQTARWAALLSGLMVFSWFWIVHLSREIAGVADGIAVFEALATAGSLFVIAGFLHHRECTPASGEAPSQTTAALRTDALDGGG